MRVVQRIWGVLQPRPLLLPAIFGLSILISPLWPQSTGSINGTVLDHSSAAIPEAHVELTEVGTGLTRTATSSPQGYFTFTDLVPSFYRLRVSATGFKDFIYGSLQLTIGQQMTLQPALEVGGVSESVEVTGTPPPVTTSSSSISQLVDSQRIDRLPLNGRNALQLVSLVPGVVSAGTTGQFGALQQQFQISGSDVNDNNFTLDGGFNMNAFYGNAANYPNPDALGEFTVTTRDYSATMGRGFTLVSAVTKSGTNDFHGTAFEFLRNTELDAKNFFAARASAYKRNQYGGTFGGRIIRDKLFFFVSYQDTTVRGIPGQSTYLTMNAAERTGDFSSIGKSIIDPAAGTPFPGNIIPSSRIEGFAAKFVQQYLPSANAGINYYSFAPQSTLDENQVIGKVDYYLTAKDHFSFRYMFDDYPQKGNGVSAFLDTSWLANLPTRTQSPTLGYTRVFSASFINEAHLTYMRAAYGVQTPKQFSLTGLGLDINSGNAISAFGLTPDSRISASGYFSASPGVPTRDIVPTTHFNDTISLLRSKQKLDFGIEIYHNRVNQLQNYLTDGTITFNGFATGNAAADFLLGNFSNYEQLTPLITRLRQTLPSLFVQDTIRVKRNLTVSVGLRWDIYRPFISENKELGTFSPGIQSTAFPNMATGLLYPGDHGLPDGIASARYNNFAPRLGIAWDARGDGRTSVRIGAGLFYMPTNNLINFNRFPQMPPFGFEVNTNAGNAATLWNVAPYNGVNPFPRPDVSDLAGLKALSFVPTSADTSLSLPFKTPLEQQWSASVQQAIGKDSVLEAAYVGSSASHLLSSYEGNPAVYSKGNSTVANTQARRLYPVFGPINELGNYLGSNYNSLQVSFNKRYSAGLSILSSYTWSKALGVVGAFGEGSFGQRDPFNQYLDYGREAYSLTHNWVTSFVWDMPFGRMVQTRALRALVAGWQLNGINTVHSGFPFTARSGLDNSFSGIGSDTADEIGNPGLSGGRSRAQQVAQWFNPAAFTLNAIGTFGTTGINSLTGPGLWDIDFGITRQFRITESKRIEFRGMFYNLLNRTNLSNPVSTVTAPNFGQITSTSTDNRVAEFGLKIAF